MSTPFVPFPSISRLSRDMIVTEKLDGTNASIYIEHVQAGIIEDREVEAHTIVRAGSRTRWITPEDDNFGFARWVKENEQTLSALGPGTHFGEWWGQGIQRGYNLKEKRFSLFNVHRWGDPATRPSIVGVVPTLYIGMFDTTKIDELLEDLKTNGSKASPGFMKPEGVVVFHVPSGNLFKKTLDKNDGHKGA